MSLVRSTSAIDINLSLLSPESSKRNKVGYSSPFVPRPHPTWGPKQPLALTNWCPDPRLFTGGGTDLYLTLCLSAAASMLCLWYFWIDLSFFGSQMRRYCSIWFDLHYGKDVSGWGFPQPVSLTNYTFSERLLQFDTKRAPFLWLTAKYWSDHSRRWDRPGVRDVAVSWWRFPVVPTLVIPGKSANRRWWRSYWNCADGTTKKAKKSFTVSCSERRR